MLEAFSKVPENVSESICVSFKEWLDIFGSLSESCCASIVNSSETVGKALNLSVAFDEVLKNIAESFTELFKDHSR